MSFLTEVLPVVLKEHKKMRRNFLREPHSVIIALMNDGTIKGILPELGYCLSKYKRDKVSKYFKASSVLNAPWKESLSYCCDIPKLTDKDLPLNWEDDITVKIGKTYLIRPMKNC